MSAGCPITGSGNNALQEKQCKNNQMIAMLQAKVDANRKFDPTIQETKVNLVQGFCGCSTGNEYSERMKTFGTIGILGILAIILFKAK
jgi:hypothetical protein